jgi:hypothetical protein
MELRAGLDTETIRKKIASAWDRTPVVQSVVRHYTDKTKCFCLFSNWRKSVKISALAHMCPSNLDDTKHAKFSVRLYLLVRVFA